MANKTLNIVLNYLRFLEVNKIYKVMSSTESNKIDLSIGDVKVFYDAKGNGLLGMVVEEGIVLLSNGVHIDITKRIDIQIKHMSIRVAKEVRDKLNELGVKLREEIKASKVKASTNLTSSKAKGLLSKELGIELSEGLYLYSKESRILEDRNVRDWQYVGYYNNTKVDWLDDKGIKIVKNKSYGVEVYGDLVLLLASLNGTDVMIIVNKLTGKYCIMDYRSHKSFLLDSETNKKIVNKIMGRLSKVLDGLTYSNKLLLLLKLCWVYVNDSDLLSVVKYGKFVMLIEGIMLEVDLNSYEVTTYSIDVNSYNYNDEYYIDYAHDYDSEPHYLDNKYFSISCNKVVIEDTNKCGKYYYSDGLFNLRYDLLDRGNDVSEIDKLVFKGYRYKDIIKRLKVEN